MVPFSDQEEQAPNPFRGCQIGACFACGFGAEAHVRSDARQQDGTTNTCEWQNDRPNPLPIFPVPDSFYTPVLLPGMYLPLGLITKRIADVQSPFYAIDTPELAEYFAAFFDHEAVHRHLLVGVVPTIMRLIASRCYLLLAYLAKDGFDPTIWRGLVLQNNTIESIHNAMAPLHEVAANVGSLATQKDNPYTVDLSQESIAGYNRIYKNFTKILQDFGGIILTLENWFAPTPLAHLTIYALAEFILMNTMDWKEIQTDLFLPPPLIPTESLGARIAKVGIPYLDTEVQPPNPRLWQIFGYSTGDITERLEDVKSRIQNAKDKRSKKPLEGAFEQMLFIANTLPDFQKWLQAMDRHSWLKEQAFNIISDIQTMIKGVGFDLSLVEGWQSDLCPQISISIPSIIAGAFRFFSYGKLEGRSPAQMFSSVNRRDSEQLEKYLYSRSLMTFTLQSNRKIGLWYAPAYGKLYGIPIRPGIHFVAENSDAVTNLTSRMLSLSVFESLREQIAVGKGVSCLFHEQTSRGCCGDGELLWGIYEAGLKAIEEIGWQPEQWIEPECDKPPNMK